VRALAQAKYGSAYVEKSYRTGQPETPCEICDELPGFHLPASLVWGMSSAWH
jgi:hypothetical protein